MALGLGFGFGFGRLKGVPSTTIYAPGLIWDEDETDARPDFDVVLPNGNGAPFDAAEDDLLRIEYSSDGGSVWHTYLTRALTQDEIEGDPFTVTGVSALSNGDYLFRDRLERTIGLNTHTSAWSDSETVTVDAPSTPRNVILVMRAG